MEVEYALTNVLFHLQKREINTLLDDVIKHMTPDRAFERHYPDLVAIVSRIITHITDFTVLFSMVSILSFTRVMFTNKFSILSILFCMYVCGYVYIYVDYVFSLFSLVSSLYIVSNYGNIVQSTTQ